MNTDTSLQTWIFLRNTPLLWLTVTLAAYAVGLVIHRLARGNHMVNPVAIAVAIVVALLFITGTDYTTYFSGAQFVHFLLGPATVALAVPLYRNLHHVRKALIPMVAALAVGAPTAALSAVGVAWLLGGTPQSLASLAPKSVTTPIAMGVAESIGGLPSLTAVMVVLTGILGAMVGTPILKVTGVRDWKAHGFAMGVASHGLGTARSFQSDPLAGTFAGIAMGLNGLVTAVLLPVAMSLM